MKASTRLTKAIKSAVEKLATSNIWVTKQEKGTSVLESVCSGFNMDKVLASMDDDYWVNFWVDTNDLSEDEMSEVVDGVMEQMIGSTVFLGTKYPHTSKKDSNKVSLAILKRTSAKV